MTDSVLAGALGAAPSPAPSPAPAEPAPPAPAPSPVAAPDWAATLSEEDRALVTSRGFASPADAIAALRGFAPPEKAEDYEIPVPDGEDPNFAKAVAPLFHKANLTAQQAKDLAVGWNEMQTAQRAAAQQAEEQAALAASEAAKREQASLKQEWGEAFDANSEHSRRAFALGAEAAGITADQMSDFVDALEAKVGFAKAVKLMAFYGKHFAEDKAHGLGERSPTVNASPQRVYDKSNMNP
jgi:hypothetical protein